MRRQSHDRGTEAHERGSLDGGLTVAASNHEQVGRALGLLAGALCPFVERECKAPLGDGWASSVGRGGRPASTSDIQSLLTVMADNWNTVFSRILDKGHRAFVGELIEARNGWAHQESFFDGHAWKATPTIAWPRLPLSMPTAKFDVPQSRPPTLRGTSTYRRARANCDQVDELLKVSRQRQRFRLAERALASDR